MTSPINFGGGVGTQPVIVNPNIGEQLAPLLEQLQFAQQQRLQQQQLAAEQANAERDDQLAALTQLTKIANDPAVLNSETGAQLAQLAGVPEQDLADMAAFAEQQKKEAAAVLENVAIAQFPNENDGDKRAEMLTYLKLADAGNLSMANEMIQRSGLLTPTEKDDADLRLTQLRGDKIQQELDTALAAVRTEKDKDEANQTIANILEVGERNPDGSYQVVPRVDYVALIQGAFAAELKPPGAVAVRFATQMLTQQTFAGLNVISAPEALLLGLQLEQSIPGKKQMDPTLVDGLQSQVNAEADASVLMLRIQTALDNREGTITVNIEVEDDSGVVTVVPTSFDIKKGPARIDAVVEKILRGQYPGVRPAAIKSGVRRARDAALRLP